jgi:hypothetical protein
MTIDICENKGFLGSLSISPERTTMVEEVPLNYRISVVSANEVIDLNGEFIVESQNIISGELIYNFQQIDRDRYKIRETQNGFTFEFSSNTDVLNFTLLNSNFINTYEAKLIVDASSSGFGRVEAALMIAPLPEIEDLTISSGGSLTAGENLQVAIIKQSENFSVINEYSFYIKDHEESNIDEANLLDINKGYSTAEIKRYFDSRPVPLESRIKNLFNYEYMKDIYPILDKQKFLFPMYMEIKFQADIGKTQLVSFLDRIGMLDYFCYMIVYRKDIIDKDKDYNYLLSIINTPDSIELEPISNNYIGAKSMINKFSRVSFQKSILLKILQNEISKLPSLLVDQIIMYKVEKLKNNVIINTKYFINNFDNQDIITFDTQVKYNIEYEYKVSKIQILNGIIRTIQMPEYSTKTRIIDSPPLFPDVSYIPYKGVDNELLINLNSNSGRYSDYPIIIKDTDQEIFDQISNNTKFSKLPQNNNKIQFETDDFVSTFELFRLETPPKSYSDFKDAYMITTNSTSILDNIKPNTKYYYIVRAIDVHGNISNPTKPIEVEIVNEGGTIYLLKKEYIFKDDSKVLFKTFKNILQIKPSKQQTMINRKSYEQKPLAATATEIKNDIQLGENEISLWDKDKQFLMRVTSKETGKKIDIKFKFTYSQPT